MLAGAGDNEFEVDPSRFMRLRLKEPDTTAASQITLNPRRGTIGEAGKLLELADRFGFVTMRIRFPHDGSLDNTHITTSLSYPVGHTAQELLPVVRFVQRANEGAVVLVDTAFHDGNTAPATMEIPGEEKDGFFDLIENWAEVERACEVDIPFPRDGVTIEAAHEVAEVATLLRGESVKVDYDTIRVPLAGADAGKKITKTASGPGPARWTFIPGCVRVGPWRACASAQSVLRARRRHR